MRKSSCCLPHSSPGGAVASFGRYNQTCCIASFTKNVCQVIYWTTFQAIGEIEFIAHIHRISHTEETATGDTAADYQLPKALR